VLVVDVGNVIEVYAEFSRSGATYTPFPDSRSHRLQLADLAGPRCSHACASHLERPREPEPGHAQRPKSRAR
jgi:hypothetical protein